MARARWSSPLWLGLASVLAACPPDRPFPDAGPGDDAGPTDAPADVPDAGDARADADASAMDSGCDDTACNEACVGAGAERGFCTQARVCLCFGEGGAPEAGPDAGPEAGVLGCDRNADCPPSLFCNGPSCSGRGFCAPRSATGDLDAAACGAEGPASCGCDGARYANVCARLLAGVRQAPASSCVGATDASAGGD